MIQNNPQDKQKNYSDDVWNSIAFDYSTAYRNEETGTTSFTHQGAWVMSAERSLLILMRRLQL